MAKQKSGNKIWIAGAVFGAVAGAAYALWKTPMSGQELRGKLSTGPVGQSDVVQTDAVHTPTAGDKIMGKLEQTLAPIVGVQLGKTANGPAPTNGTVTEPIAVVTPPSEAAAAAEPPPATGSGYGSETISTRRYAWGTPAPETTEPAATKKPEESIEAAAPVVQAIVEKAQKSEKAEEPVAATASADYGSQTLRSNTYRWGEPAPEAGTPETRAAVSTATVKTDGAQPSTDQLATAGSTVVGEKSPVASVSSAAASSANKRPFPKLGGLEN